MLQPRKQLGRAIGMAAFMLAICTHVGANDDMLTGKSGLTFYTFDKDAAGSGKSACDELCLKSWPAVPENEATGKDFGSIRRDDGTTQLTYRGQPVYHYRDDHKPGDALGDGVGGLWHVLRATTRSSGQAVQKVYIPDGY